MRKKYVTLHFRMKRLALYFLMLIGMSVLFLLGEGYSCLSEEEVCGSVVGMQGDESCFWKLSLPEKAIKPDAAWHDWSLHHRLRIPVRRKVPNESAGCVESALGVSEMLSYASAIGCPSGRIRIIVPRYYLIYLRKLLI